uniref:Uncharacterized protein n=1 Tax=Staphylococcus aureus TaxID=1280 RepID=Q9LBZ3_STAAU|nr:hypothetical protein [Staphylococcus aureus]
MRNFFITITLKVIIEHSFYCWCFYCVYRESTIMIVIPKGCMCCNHFTLFRFFFDSIFDLFAYIIRF